MVVIVRRIRGYGLVLKKEKNEKSEKKSEKTLKKCIKLEKTFKKV